MKVSKRRKGGAKGLKTKNIKLLTYLHHFEFQLLNSYIVTRPSNNFCYEVIVGTVPNDSYRF